MNGPPPVLGEVVEGSNGRLFLGRQLPFDLDQFLHEAAPGSTQLIRWRRTLERRAAELAALGVPYVFYIAPDAPSVYPEDLPSYLSAPDVTLGQRVADALTGIPNLTVVYPRAALLEAKGGLELYRKTDTHWSGYGAFVAYQSLSDGIRGLVPFSAVEAGRVRFVMTPEIGDLGSLLDPEREGGNPSMRISGSDVVRDSFVAGTHRMNSQRFSCHDAAETHALVLRDSFMTEQSPLVARSFRQTEMLGTTSRLFLDHVRNQGFDIVISQISERRLQLWENDHQLLGYDDIFGTDWASDLGRIALAAVMALDCGDNPRAASCVPDLLRDEANLSAGHASVVARVCLTCGDAATADRLIGRALKLVPDRASFLCIAAQARFALGDGNGALALVGRACSIMPWNGYVYELTGYLLIAIGQFAKALACLELGMERIKDDAQLYHWASVAAEGAGDRADALVKMNQAFMLWPENPAYGDRHASLKALGNS